MGKRCVVVDCGSELKRLDPINYLILERQIFMSCTRKWVRCSARVGINLATLTGHGVWPSSITIRRMFDGYRLYLGHPINGLLR